MKADRFLKNLDLTPCHPPSWATGGHKQTLFGYFLPHQKIQETGKKLAIDLGDGDQLVCRFLEGNKTITLCLFHGLVGSTDSNYMQIASRIARQMGLSVLLVNHRGCGEGQGFAKKPYHSGVGKDVSKVVEYIRQNRPKDLVVAMGFSLGANAILTLLTGLSGNSLPDSAAVFNAPIDLSASSEKISRGLNIIYDYEFTKLCKRDIRFRQKHQLLSKPIKIPIFARLPDIDIHYTAPEGGFKSANDYYEKCSTYLHLKKVQIPTLIVTAKDDPIVPWKPYENANGNKNILLSIQDHGGHLGFITRNRLGTFDRWLSYSIKSYLQSFLV